MLKNLLGRLIAAIRKLLMKHEIQPTPDPEPDQPRDVEYVAKYPSAPGLSTYENKNVLIDYSNVAEGYVFITYTGEVCQNCKVQIVYGEKEQHFNLPGDGTQKAFPLCFGDGYYQIDVFRHAFDDNYIKVTKPENFDVIVELNDPLAPWLYPNTYADYGPESECVKLAARLCAGARTYAERVKTVTDYITKKITYDKELAERVQTEKWWLPVPDEVIAAGKSICFGFSSLGAGMLRPLGIPTKICVGYTKLTPGLHAWNEVFIAGAWQILDLTYLAQAGGKISALFTRENYHTTLYCG